MKGEFTLDDLAKQLQLLRKMPVPTDSLSELADYFRDNRQETLDRIERIMAVLRPEERLEIKRVGPTECIRIASESGVSVVEVDRFLAGFKQLRARMQELAKMGFFQRLGFIFTGRALFTLLPWLLVIGLLVMRQAGR